MEKSREYASHYPEWYWTTGLHDAGIVGVESFEFPFDYNKFIGCIFTRLRQKSACSSYFTVQAPANTKHKTGLTLSRARPVFVYFEINLPFYA